jgi:hypothetical protein
VKLSPGVVLVCLGSLVGCETPTRPYGQGFYDPTQAVEPALRPAQLEGGRVIVVGALDDETLAPIGGLYDDTSGTECPLEQTYAFWALAPKLRFELRGALRACGLRTYAEDLDLGAPIPCPSPPYPPGLVVLRGVVRSFAYERQAQGEDLLVGELSWRLLEGHSGRVLWEGEQQVAVRVPVPEVGEEETAPDPFGRFAAAVVAQLLAEPEVRVSLEGKS